MDDIVTQLHEYITTSLFVVVVIAVISAIYTFASIVSMYTASIVRQEDDDYHSGSARIGVGLGVGLGVLNETEQSDLCNEKLLKELTGEKAEVKAEDVSNEPSFMPYEGSGFLTLQRQGYIRNSKQERVCFPKRPYIGNGIHGRKN